MTGKFHLSPWPHYPQDEIDAASATLSSGKVNYWTGSLGKEFEAAYAKSVGRKHGLALSNGTVALELALRAFGIGPGDEVIVASRTYVASATCVMLLGAKPVFCDVDAHSGNMSPATIAPHITTNTKAIIPVHVGGWPCDMPGIMALAAAHNLVVIEDCAQAHGASIAGKPVGGWGHAAAFSFCQDKIISTGGEGGLLVLDDEEAFERAWAYKDIGRDFHSVYKKVHPPGFRWYTESAGSNFRMTEFQAAIGLKQLHKLPDWIKRRQKNAQQIKAVLRKFDWLEIQEPVGDVKSAYYRQYAIVREDAVLGDLSGEALRDSLVHAMNKAHVPCFVGSCAEVYREKVFVDSGDAPRTRFKNAKIFTERAFCFLTHHTITPEELAEMCLKIQITLREFSNEKALSD
jgi:dTDP-4-amino-4,6-dideoxygalactose transaminase